MSCPISCAFLTGNDSKKKAERNTHWPCWRECNTSPGPFTRSRVYKQTSKIPNKMLASDSAAPHPRPRPSNVWDCEQLAGNAWRSIRIWNQCGSRGICSKIYTHAEPCIDELIFSSTLANAQNNRFSMVTVIVTTSITHSHICNPFPFIFFPPHTNYDRIVSHGLLAMNSLI